MTLYLIISLLIFAPLQTYTMASQTITISAYGHTGQMGFVNQSTEEATEVPMTQELRSAMQRANVPFISINFSADRNIPNPYLYATRLFIKELERRVQIAQEEITTTQTTTVTTTTTTNVQRNIAQYYIPDNPGRAVPAFQENLQPGFTYVPRNNQPQQRTLFQKIINCCCCSPRLP